MFGNPQAISVKTAYITILNQVIDPIEDRTLNIGQGPVSNP